MHLLMSAWDRRHRPPHPAISPQGGRGRTSPTVTNFVLHPGDHTVRPQRNASGFTLAEVVVSIGIVAVVTMGIVNGYLVAARRAEWVALSESAQAATLQRMAQARAARWDMTADPPIDHLMESNFPPVIVPMFTPLGGTNITYCTNFTLIRLVQKDPALKMIRTESRWQFPVGRFHTNGLTIYRSPDP